MNMVRMQRFQWKHVRRVVFRTRVVEKEQRFVIEHVEDTEAVHEACNRSVFRNFFVEREQRFISEHGKKAEITGNMFG